MATAAAKRIRGREREELAQELGRRVSGEVRFDAFSRVLYSTDASIYQMEPVGVVIPRSVEDVLAVVEVARANGVPALPRGGGTALAGQTVNHAIVVDFSKYLNQLLEVNREEHWARVQPGIVLEQLNKQLSAHGLQYAPDPTTANRACVGGGIGNNTCGAHSVIYGKTLDHVKELDVVLADGTQTRFRPLEAHELENKLSAAGLESDIYRGVRRIARENLAEIVARYPKIMRRVSGYNVDEFLGDDPFNLSRMVVGSEGTLCVVTEAKINLVPRPAMTALSVLHFTGIVEASEATREVLKHDPSSVEVMDKILLDRSRESLGHSRGMAFIEGDPGALLAVEFYGESEAELASKMNALKEDMARRRLGYACINMLDKAAQANVWNLRRAGLGLLMSIHGDAKPLPFVEDTAVDPENLGEFVHRFDDIVRNHGTEAAYYGHASVGCLHVRPLVSLKDSQGVATMVSIADEISDLVREFGGSLSGEHGDGIVRGVWTEKMFGPEITQMFREVKNTFDPQGIMNPGKIIDCPPMTENLRFGPEYRPASFPTTLDFAVDTDYAGAVEMCNGMGACRKLDGAMCPSFMTTWDEEHSTRGRANLLRAALSGRLPEGTITGERFFEAMDLCLECKACKSECDSGVDMAKLKYEFLDRYYKANGRPLRNKVFAHINRVNRLGSRFAPISNWVARSPLGRLAAGKVLGVHPKRPLPPFVRETLPKWFGSRRRGDPPVSPLRKGGGKGRSTLTKGGPEGGHTVVLFNDTFMNYNYPRVGRAAVELLEAAGFRVELANAGCCGRPMISKGLLDGAATQARHNVDLLHHYASQGIPIVGCEPSCLLTLRDEYPDFLKDEKSRAVAEHSYLIDEFLMMLDDRGELELEFRDVSKKVLFHGHCHQKALVGMDSSIRALSLPPRYQVEAVNAGCCGMAGSFGYEREHFDISMAIGGLALFPAVNAKDADWEVAVSGVSCRAQIEQGTGRPARHLVEVLRDALA
ncbi:MAG: FAD-linked oxidase C-terminal domain-containing protein [Dehalococcoidia bacterium]|jgi:FAD/FMN-containing dehydrogenase/Fe-S oxidoreductase|nr:FAD-linked oxidase C-terminal domain-containing protein [Dehalococcoidia bacterium]